MMNIIVIFYISLFIIFIQALDAMEACFLMLIKTSLAALIISLISSSLWYPLIMLMLTVGGVTVTFAILSSLSPKVSMKGMKNKKLMLTTILSMLMIFNFNLYFMKLQMKVSKWFMSSEFNLLIMTLILLIYITSISSFISEEKMTMKSILCLN